MVILMCFLLLVGLLEELGFFYLWFMLLFYCLFSMGSGLSFSIFFSQDSISFGMCILTVLVFYALVLAGVFEAFAGNMWVKVLVFSFMAGVFLLAFFCTSSMFVFYLLFEFSIVPVFVMVLGWGYSEGRFQAALYMFFYMFTTSLPMLFLLMFMGLADLSLMFDYGVYLINGESFFGYWWLFFLVVFMAKLPLFFLHLWLPKAHVEAPLLGSVILAGVLLKLGGYGLYKVIVFMYWQLFHMAFWFLVFSVWGSLMMCMVCLRQVDMKNLVAYSSVVHMGPVFVGLMVYMGAGLCGSYWVMVSHGLCSSCLFFLVNLCYLVLGSRSFFIIRGGLMFMPFVSYFWFFFSVCNMGFPPTFNFFSELMVMAGSFTWSPLMMALFALLLMGSGLYSVLMYVFLNHGSLKSWFKVLVFVSLSGLLVLFLFSFLLVAFLLYMWLMFLCQLSYASF